jgi:regulator of RNase E activity RraA
VTSTASDDADQAGQLLTGFGELDVSAVSDALDRLGIAGQCSGIKPLERSFRLVGRAWTLRYAPAGTDGGTVGDYVDDLGPGQAVVIDNAGRLDATVWGDLLTLTAWRRGVAGTVIDGVCRDSDRSVGLGYPIFSRGSWMRTGKDRVRLEGYQVPVSIGGVRVEPGDILVGEADGVVAVPASRAAEVLDAAREIAASEPRIREAVEAGVSLTEARASVGYHQLQRHRG